MSALAVLAASVLAACTSNSTSSAPPTGNSSGPILIGASLSLSAGTAANPDTFQADGLAFRRGYELWASDVNKNGGLLGRQVVLKILDDGGLPNQVVTNYQTLFGKDHVDLAFGPFSSLLSGPASAVAARYGMPFAAAAFVFQWQQGQFVQVLPSATDGPSVIDKTPWIGAGTKGPAA
jgi:branched-chain amino acid transport system substrate-binding protein